MKVNGPMLFYQIQKYLKVDYSHITQNNYVKTPIFYNTFFDMNEHIVLVDARDLLNCLERVQHAIIICLDRPDLEIKGQEKTNDLIILDDPMSDKMAFNILNHVLEFYQDFEHDLNEVLYTRHSFQDMIEVITDVLELPLALSDSNFRYVAYSSSSNEYIDHYVTQENTLPEETIQVLRQNKSFRQLEQITEAFVYQGVEPCVCKNIYHDHNYMGRLAVILPDNDVDVEYCKAIFDISGPFLEILYEQYNSFSNVTIEYRKIHEFLHLIFDRKPADRRAFLNLMHQMKIQETDDLAVIDLIPEGTRTVLYNVSFICEHLERSYPGCFCITIKEHIVLLVSLTCYQKTCGSSFLNDFGKELEKNQYRAGASRIFHVLDVFEILYSARNQALYALEHAGDISGPKQPGTRDRTGESRATENPNIYYFDHYALQFLLQHGSDGTTYLQNCHPALITLQDHDSHNETSYLKTLRVYMDANMNAVAAAKKLYIHRSSFISRMERIQKLVHLDLEDPKERLYINLSFAIFFSDENKQA